MASASAGRRLSLAAAIASLLGGRPASAAGPSPPPAIRVDPGATAQEIEHFGASAAWWAQRSGSWPAAERERVLDLLFDPVSGIGLDLVRYNVGGGKAEAKTPDPWRSAESPLAPDGSLDWSRDAAALAVVDGAVRRGARVLAFFNSPPAPLTVTGAPTGNGRSSNLRPDRIEAFAKHIARCALELSRRWSLAAVSPINEPQWDWKPSKGQEGSRYSPREAAALVAAAARALREAGLDLPLAAVDSGEWKLSGNRPYVEALLAEPDAASALSLYSLHSYWSSAADRAAFAVWFSKRLPGARVWMTEWTEMRSGKDAGMRAALELARTVHEDLCLGGATSWQYWIAVSKYDYADGLIYVDEARASFEPTKKLWALGNWSRFVEPGARRVACSVASAPGILASAFRNPDGSLIVVAINPVERDSAALRLILPPGSPPVADLELWETSESRDLERRDLGEGEGIRLPARSVTTLVLRTRD